MEDENRVSTCVAGIRGEKMKTILSVILAFVLVLTVPITTAFADDDVPVNCTLAPFAMETGTDTLKERDNHTRVKNKGASISITVDCGLDGALSGIMVTDHGSRVKVNKEILTIPGLPPEFSELFGARFAGKLKGDFVLYSPIWEVIGTGELKARVEGVMLVSADGRPVVIGGNVVTLNETIDGEWEFEGESVDEGEGDFNLELDFTDLVPFGGFLTGEVELDDDDDDD